MVVTQEPVFVINKKTWYGITTYTLKNENGVTLSELCVREEIQDDKQFFIEEYIDKKILYLTDFSTREKYRKKGYGKYLLTEVIKRYKGKYDILHLNACPFFLTHLGAVYETPKNGLEMNKLVQFYKQVGFTELKKKDAGNYTCTVMIMNLK